ncbi:MAG TPA: thiamine pyrophosphate-requiring protein [Gammaproteobacteria bacterium]|nr:thiamine pyrophosphate-requiring protein [Gammaproteobacteria bacterium]
MPQAKHSPVSVAETLLRSLKRRGIDYVFANAGTDFAPIIEALVKLRGEPDAAPRFVTVPHENLAVAMAHGYYLTSGRPAAVMVHVTVGTGNTVCALMNAYRDDVPVLLMAGRTPHTQSGHIASRNAPIHWGQEHFDQAGIVREYTKWDYELRAGQPVDEIVGRALDAMLSEPRGPAYLTLPREVLADEDRAPSIELPRTVIAEPQPSPSHVAAAAEWLAAAERPVILTTHLGRDAAAAAALAELAESFSIPVAQPGATCVNLAASHAMNVGGGNAELLSKADAILVVEAEVPWFPRSFTPAPGVKIVHLGVDPLWTRYPIRTFPADLAIAGNPRTALRLLAGAMAEQRIDRAGLAARRDAIARLQAERRAKREAALAKARTQTPIAYDYVGECVRQALPAGAIVVTELGVSLDQLGLEEPGSLIGVGIGGGLGFGLGASLGAKIAAPERTVVSTIGDGSYMFGNPTPFHLVARAANLPVLTIVCNNGRWQAVDSAARAVYPDGLAAQAEVMPLVELQPSPEFTKVAEASDAFARRVDDPRELPNALRAALDAVRGGRQALLDVRMEHGIR